MAENKYTKEQLTNAELEDFNPDVLQVVLEDKKTYTMREVKKLVDAFNKEKEDK